MFADDVNAIVEDTDLNNLIDKANRVTNNMSQWYFANKFSIHPNKSRIMLFKSKFRDLSYEALELSINVRKDSLSWCVLMRLETLETILFKLDFVIKLKTSKELV